MKLECTHFHGPCACGLSHTVQTRKAIIEAGCLETMDTELACLGLHGPRTALYDTNTYRLFERLNIARPAADQEIILEAAHLAADAQTAASVLEQLAGSTKLLIIVGSGTLHNIGRYCASRAGIPYVSCPTAASTDAYASSISMLSWRGLPSAVACEGPVLLLADPVILQDAPAALTRAGVGEAISKFTALADWKIATLLGRQQACPSAEALLRQSAVAAYGCCNDLQSGNIHAYAQLMYALVLSGLAQQIQGSHIPASGSEHLLAIQLQRTTSPSQDTYFGEYAGVAAAEIAYLYHRMAAIDNIAPFLQAAEPMNMDWLTEQFGEETAYLLMDENTPDCLSSVSAADFAQGWPEIRRIIADIPSADTLRGILACMGAKTSTEALGIPASKLPRTITQSQYVSNQLTLVRAMRLLELYYDNRPRASRAPSHRSRYADSAINRAGSSKAVSASSM